MAAPAAISQLYASDVLSSFDFYKPQYLEELFSRYGDQGMSYFQTLRMMGFEKPVGLDTYGHFEEDWIHETFHVDANVADPGAGNDALITLDAVDLDANNEFYPRLYANVQFPNEVVGYIANINTTTPTAPVLTVRPFEVTDNIGALTAGDELIIYSNSFSEGSGQIDPAVRGTIKYENDAQIIKETVSTTGSEMVNQPWFSKTSRGTSIPSYWYLGQLDIDYRMNLAIDGALLMSKRVTNPNAVDPTTNRPIKATEGMIPYIRSKGNPYPKNLNSFAVDDFDTIDRTLDQYGVGKKSLCMLGIKRHQEFEKVLKADFQDTNINYAHQTVNADIFKGNESLGLTVNFKYLVRSERLFMFKRFNNLNNIKTFGATGYKMNEYGVFLPVNTKKDPKRKQNGRNVMVESIGVRYRALNSTGYSRRMETYDVKGAGPGLKVTEFDTANTYQRGHIGAHFRGAPQFVLVHST